MSRKPAVLPPRGASRRAFLQGPCATAAAAIALAGCATSKLEKGAAPEKDPGGAALKGKEFILDAQTHHVDASPDAVWPINNPFYGTILDEVSRSQQCGARERFGCLSQEAYARELFVKSETAVAVLTGVPALLGKNPLPNDALLATQRRINELAASPRVLVAGLVHPNVGRGELEAMRELAERGKVIGWTVYTPFGLDGTGWFLDDEQIGFPFLERARALKRPIVFAPKGLPWPNFDRRYCSPRDIGPAAKAFPDVQLVVSHAGYERDVPEGPYDPFDAFGKKANVDLGVNRLIKSLEESGIWPNQNVYADLSGTWALLMEKPVEAAHVLGKLLKHVGEDRVLWASDGLFLGSPQAQIDAFRAFEIPLEFQEKYGYPALTRQVKTKIFGANAARLLGVDPNAVRHELRGRDVERLREASWGGPSRRDLLGLRAGGEGNPG